MPRILEPTQTAIAEAVRRLRDGGVVAFPTETVYGLSADTFNTRAIERIYQLKGRPFNNPLIAHVLGIAQARTLFDRTQIATSVFETLASRFWPGPLTLVMHKSSAVPDRATAGLQTIAVRAPAHPVARQLLESFGGPISAPSANRSGHVSPTIAQHVESDFSEESDLFILDGGPCEVGIESTVLDLTTTLPRVLRPGSVTVEQLKQVIGEVEVPAVKSQAASPGTAERHYAPRTPAILVASSEFAARLRQEREPVAALTFHPELVEAPHKAIAMPDDPAAYAQALYSALRRADELHCKRIHIEEPPGQADLWRAVRDRLFRATSKVH